MDTPVSNSIFALLSFHPMGYLREAAIQELSFDYPDITIPVLLIRANDWVQNVHILAAKKLKKFIETGNTDIFLDCLTLIAQLHQKKRYHHALLISLIEDKLLQKCYKKLLEAILDKDKVKSRTALRITARNDSEILQIIKISRLSHDIVIKLEGLKLASKLLACDVLMNFLYDYLKDKSAIVRKQCIYLFLEKFPDKIKSVLTETLFDQAFSVRELASFYLRQNGIAQVSQIYKNALLQKKKPLL